MRVLYSLIILLYMSNASSGQGQYQGAYRTYNVEVTLKDSVTSFSYAIDFRKTDTTDNATYKTTSIDTFLLLLKDDLSTLQDSEKNILFYLHGMMGGQRINLYYTKKDLEERYIHPLDSDISRLISIRWPGNLPVYKVDKQNAVTIAPLLSEWMLRLIEELQGSEETKETKFDIINHSLGCELFKELTLHFPKAPKKYFDQILFCAPDLDIDVFNKNGPLAKLHLYCNRTTVYFSNKDVTLGFSRELNKKGRLGLDGPHLEIIHHSALDFVEMSHVMDEKMLPMRLTGHSYYRGSDIGALDIKQTLNGVPSHKIEGRDPSNQGTQFYKIIAKDQ